MVNQTKLKESIKLIENTIINDLQEEMESVFGEMMSLYKEELKNINLFPLYDASAKMDNMFNGTNKHVERYPQNYKKNLKRIKDKLESLVDEGQNENGKNGNSPISISLINTNSNENTVTMNINITFDEVKQRIDNMDEQLNSKEIAEIKSKIDEIQKIVESKDKKSQKWNKLSSLLKWIADKSVDVGIALLPLILKINS